MYILAGYQRHMIRWNFSIDAGDVMDTRPPPISVHGVQTDEILLSMASHLCWSSRNHEVSRNAPPISFPKLVQSQ